MTTLPPEVFRLAAAAFRLWKALGMAEQPLTDEVAYTVVDQFLDEGANPDEVAALVAAWRDFDVAARNALDAFDEPS